MLLGAHPPLPRIVSGPRRRRGATQFQSGFCGAGAGGRTACRAAQPRAQTQGWDLPASWPALPSSPAPCLPLPDTQHDAALQLAARSAGGPRAAGIPGGGQAGVIALAVGLDARDGEPREQGALGRACAGV